MAEAADLLHPTAEAFLDALGLPSNHPYLDEELRVQNGGGYPGGSYLNVDHHEWSLLEYFFPARTASTGGTTTMSSPPSLSSGSIADRGAAALPRCDSERPEPGAILRSERLSDPSGEEGQPFNSASPVLFGGGGGAARVNPSARDPVAGITVAGSASDLASMALHAWRQVVPCVMSTFHLCFLRLFCPVLWASGIAYLIAQPLVEADRRLDGDVKNQARSRSGRWKKIYGYLNIIGSLTALLTSMTMMTDTMYVMEYSRPPLVALFLLTAGLVAVRSTSKQRAAAIILPVVAASAAIWLTCDLDLPTIGHPELRSGLYYDGSSPVAKAVVEGWDADKRTYDDGRGTPWLVNGDTRTGIPFVVNNLPEQKFVRRWLPTEVTGETEAVILDIAFPSDGIHRFDRPLYLLVHGLNGGSNEGYVRDFVLRRRIEGSTIAVMVTRGLMDSPVLGPNLLHFARISDIASASNALRRAAGPDQTVAGVGYSMGAICLANYVARSGGECRLDAAVALSGALDTRVQLDYRRSSWLWQPFLAKTLRETMMGKFAEQIRSRLTPDEVTKVEEASSIVELDRALFVRYNGFDDIVHYYSEMGAMGDWESFNVAAPRKAGRIANISVPLLNVNSLDDPIGDPRCLRDSEKLVNTGSGNLFVLLTERGGHVGWPLGVNPAKHGWRWMSDVASSFVESVDAVRRKNAMAEAATANKTV